jgi:phosphatidyl-myo-inositol dimannoside synthase
MIVGDGDHRARLEQEAKSLGLSEQIIFTGGFRNTRKHLTTASRMHTSCRVTARGSVSYFSKHLACGVPVIGSKVDGSHEALLDGQLGRLVDPNLPGRTGEGDCCRRSGRVRAKPR